MIIDYTNYIHVDYKDIKKGDIVVVSSWAPVSRRMLNRRYIVTKKWSNGYSHKLYVKGEYDSNVEYSLNSEYLLKYECLTIDEDGEY